MRVERINPEALPQNPAYAQGVSVEGAARTIYVGGQNGIGADGSVVEGGLEQQTVRALQNVEAVLAAGGARLEDAVSWTIFVVEGQSLAEGFAGFQQVWGARGEPPAISMAFVAGLARPGLLVEVSAIAVTGA